MIVTDELGTEIGFVTFEHVVKALLGPVEDEFGNSAPHWQKGVDGSIISHGSLSLLSLEDALDLSVPDVEANSVGGPMIEQLGRIPKPEERMCFPRFEIEVLAMQGAKIERVCVRSRAVKAGGA